ncbi:MAG: thioredoxin [Bacteroidota bacterium]
MRVSFLTLLLVVAPAAFCQTAPAPSGDSVTATPLPASVETRTEAEQAVAEIIAQEGIHVVRFWAPWCHNSMNELRAGLYEIIDQHPDVTFTFVTVRNDGEDGQSTLDRFGIPDRVTILAEQNRDPLTFLGLPITWTPTTWIFNREGKLAYAFNYGEVTPALLTQAIADADHHWHD